MSRAECKETVPAFAHERSCPESKADESPADGRSHLNPQTRNQHKRLQMQCTRTVGEVLSERRSEPDVIKSSHMRITSRDESERRHKDREREQDWIQMRRTSGITRSRSDLHESNVGSTRSRREPDGRAATPTDRMRFRFGLTQSHKRCHKSGVSAVSTGVKECWSAYRGA